MAPLPLTCTYQTWDTDVQSSLLCVLNKFNHYIWCLSPNWLQNRGLTYLLINPLLGVTYDEHLGGLVSFTFDIVSLPLYDATFKKQVESQKYTGKRTGSNNICGCFGVVKVFLAPGMCIQIAEFHEIIKIIMFCIATMPHSAFTAFPERKRLQKPICIGTPGWLCGY